MFFNLIHLEILSFFIYYHFMNLSNIRNRYSFNALSLFGYIDTILLILCFIIFLKYMDYGWMLFGGLFCSVIVITIIGIFLSTYIYIYEHINENFRIKNEKFLSNKFIFFLQIIGVFLNLIPLTLMSALFIR